jgi:2-polyprenyl-3-methyl-5-hydroxy-6-metoxy-1,4-benzoquinol methylase
MFDIPSRIILHAERLVATASPDHIVPGGTKHDNSRNPRCNAKLYDLLGGRQDLRILDLGCAGGGFVRECIDDGHLAVELEGSDLSKRQRRAEWRAIPEYLFTCDITAPFAMAGVFEDATKPLRFDAVTSWKLLEHIAEADRRPWPRTYSQIWRPTACGSPASPRTRTAKAATRPCSPRHDRSTGLARWVPVGV